MSQFENKYDLEKRTLNFSKDLIKVLKQIKKDSFLDPLVMQCVRAGTSIGANYREANGASSKKEFSSKISICKREAKETMYWLELIGEQTNDTDVKNSFRDLWLENKELTLIFSKVLSSCKNKN